MIPVTKPFLPPLDEYQNIVTQIWERRWLTNNGPAVLELEERLGAYLKLPKPLFLTNGTIAIQIALKALGLKGEIITTPFSYVATTSSIVWENCHPIFVDIDANTANIDPQKIEAAITPQTTAILATHCFGNPCDISAIEVIAKNNNLKVVYDAAHCFGTLYKGKSVFAYGDVTTTSFHATKLFHTIEGGAVFTNNDETRDKMSYMRNFGHNGPEKFQGLGINGKNSEFHAAMGLVNLKYIETILISRKEQCKRYEILLNNLDIKFLKLQEHSQHNNAYFPMLLADEVKLKKVKKSLEENKIFPRRYFYPSLSSLSYVRKVNTPVSDSLASRVLCLPLYHGLKILDQNRIVDIIKRTSK